MTVKQQNSAGMYAKYLADVPADKVERARQLVEASEFSPEPNNSGISTEEFLDALQTLAQRYKKA